MEFRKRSKQMKVARWLCSILIVVVCFYLTESRQYAEIKAGDSPVLYSSICNDNLEEIFCEAIKEAKKSVLLVIYSLSDAKLIHALNKQAREGIEVDVIHDSTTPPWGFRKLCPHVHAVAIKLSGLMHQKILIIDQEKVLIGSANMTAESLKLHDNLVVGLINPELAAAIDNDLPFLSFSTGNQLAEYWNLPQKGKEGVKRLIELIDQATTSIRVAMFTWTHQELTRAIICAHNRGVHVEIILDRGQATGAGLQTYEKLLASGLDVSLSSGLGLLHHKFAWIDEKILINGSANWTQAAFSRNRDCFLILYPLTETQNQKMHTLWQKTKAASTHEIQLSLAA